MICPTCQQEVRPVDLEDCRACDGTGKAASGLGDGDDDETCLNCHGAGDIDVWACACETEED